MVKEEIRKQYKGLRSQLTDEEIDTLSLAIANKTLELPIWEKECYHLFLPIAKQKEVDTEYLLHILQGKDKLVVLPKTNFETYTLSHFLLTDSTAIRNNKWGIPEPESGIEIAIDKIDVVFVPLLAFDRSGNRIGYGKGFYDMFLEGCRQDVLKIGLSFFEPLDKIEDLLTSDIPLDYCITASHIYKF